MEPGWHIPSVGILLEQETFLSFSKPQRPTLGLHLTFAYVYYCLFTASMLVTLVK